MKTLGYASINSGVVCGTFSANLVPGLTELVSRQDAEDIINQRNGEIVRLHEECENWRGKYKGVEVSTRLDLLTFNKKYGDALSALVTHGEERQKLAEENAQLRDENATLKADVIREQNTVAGLKAKLQTSEALRQKQHHDVEYLEAELAGATVVIADLQEELKAARPVFISDALISDKLISSGLDGFFGGTVRADSPEGHLNAFLAAGGLVKTTTTTEQVGEVKRTESTTTCEPPVAKAETVARTATRVKDPICEGEFPPASREAVQNALIEAGWIEPPVAKAERAKFGPVNITVSIAGENSSDEVTGHLKRIIAEQMGRAMRPGGVLHK